MNLPHLEWEEWAVLIALLVGIGLLVNVVRC